MRIGWRGLLLTLVLFAVLSSPAAAASTLSVFADQNQIAVGSGTQIAAHAETDADYSGGHVAFKFKPAEQECLATPAEDQGVDATGAQPTPVSAGPGVADVAGAPIQLDVGTWRICGWLVNDATGGIAAAGSTVVRVMPYSGSLTLSLKKSAGALQVVLGWKTSAPGYLYASIQPVAKQCPRDPAKMPKGSLLVLPRGGRYVGSDGGLGRTVPVDLVGPGRWRVCSWLRTDFGSVGPASKTFGLPRPSRGARASG